MAELTNFGSIDINGKQVNIDSCTSTDLYDYQAVLQKRQKEADKDIQEFLDNLSKKIPEYRQNKENYRKIFTELQHTKNGVDHSLRLLEVAIFSRESEEQIEATTQATRKEIGDQAKKYGKAAVKMAKVETEVDDFEEDDADKEEDRDR